MSCNMRVQPSAGLWYLTVSSEHMTLEQVLGDRSIAGHHHQGPEHTRANSDRNITSTLIGVIQ